MELVAQVHSKYSPSQCQAGEKCYARHTLTHLAWWLTVALLTCGLIDFGPVVLPKQIALLLLLYVLGVSMACGGLIHARRKFYRRTPDDVVCSLTFMTHPRFDHCHMNPLGIGGFFEVLLLAEALLCNGRLEQAREILNTGWNTMQHCTPSVRLRAHILHFTLLTLLQPQAVNSHLPSLLRAYRHAPLTAWLTARRYHLAPGQLKQCWTRYCAGNWPQVLARTEPLTTVNQPSPPFLHLWILRFQAALYCGEPEQALTALRALSQFPALVEVLQNRMNSPSFPPQHEL